MSTMPDHLRHAQHVGSPHPGCAVCVALAEARHKRAHRAPTVDEADQFRSLVKGPDADNLARLRRLLQLKAGSRGGPDRPTPGAPPAGVPVPSADRATVRAVGGFVQQSARFVR